MMIRPDQIEGVQPEQPQRKDKVRQPGNAFGDILNQEVARGDAPAKTQGAVPPPIVNPLIAAGMSVPCKARTTIPLRWPDR